MNQSLAISTHSERRYYTGRSATYIYRRERQRPVLRSHNSGHGPADPHLYCIICTRRYEATAVIEVQKDNKTAWDSTLMSGPGGPGDALNAALDLQTQSEVLQSDTLALRVIQQLDLEHTKDFKGHFSPIGWVMGLLSPGGVSDPANATLEDSPARRSRVLKIFSNNLKVKVDSGSRLIDVSYLSSDPRTSAAVVNALVQELTEYSFETRLAATSQSSTWLSGQLGALRKQSEQLESKVANLQKDMGVFSLGDSDSQGKPQIYSSVLDRLQQQTTALAAAESNRIMKGALYRW